MTDGIEARATELTVVFRGSRETLMSAGLASAEMFPKGRKRIRDDCDYRDDGTKEPDATVGPWMVKRHAGGIFTVQYWPYWRYYTKH